MPQLQMSDLDEVLPEMHSGAVSTARPRLCSMTYSMRKICEMLKSSTRMVYCRLELKEMEVSLRSVCAMPRAWVWASSPSSCHMMAAAAASSK